MYGAVGKSYREVSGVLLKKPLKEPIDFRRHDKAGYVGHYFNFCSLKEISPNLQWKT